MKVIYAKTFFEKLIGLSFKKKIDYILGFENCQAIHTFFMKTKIDIVMANKNKEVLYVFKNISPNKIIWKRKSYWLYEIPIPNNFNFKKNDIINF